MSITCHNNRFFGIKVSITSVILLIVHTLRYIKSQKKRHFCTGRTLQISECHKLQRQSFGRNPTTRLSRL